MAGITISGDYLCIEQPGDAPLLQRSGASYTDHQMHGKSMDKFKPILETMTRFADSMPTRDRTLNRTAEGTVQANLAGKLVWSACTCGALKHLPGLLGPRALVLSCKEQYGTGDITGRNVCSPVSCGNEETYKSSCKDLFHRHVSIPKPYLWGPPSTPLATAGGTIVLRMPH